MNSANSVTVVVVQFAIVLEIWIRASSENFSVAIENGERLEMQPRGDGLFVFALPEPEIAMRIGFVIATGDTKVDVTRIQLLYQVMQFPIAKVSVVSKVPALKEPVGAIHASQKLPDRTDVFQFKLASVGQFSVEATVDRNVPQLVAFFFAGYMDEQLVFEQHFVVPEVESGKRMWFRLDAPIEVNTVKIFYVHRIPVIKRPVIGIIAEPIRPP
jgi:hypothetical protein